MIDRNFVKVKGKGDHACFTQPALKVERMTYPCMTPSADEVCWSVSYGNPSFNGW